MYASLRGNGKASIEKRIPREVFITAPTYDNPHIPKHRIEEARRLLPENLFRQYWLAEFLDSSDVWPALPIDKEYWKEEYQKEGPVEYWIAPEADSVDIVAGCDWARQHDYTVLTCWDYTKKPYRCVGFLRFHKRPYPKQIVSIVKFLKRYKSCEILLHDKTGVGVAISDMLDRVPDLVHRGVVFSNASKAEMVNTSVTLVEREEVLFPNWPTMKKEFQDFEVDVTNLGLMRYQAMLGSHDDIVFSTCLGLVACEEFVDRNYEVRYLEDLGVTPLEQDPLESYMDEMLDIDFEEGF